MDPEVGGSIPPNCTTTVELPRILSILLIRLTYSRRQNYKGGTNGVADILGFLQQELYSLCEMRITGRNPVRGLSYTQIAESV